MRDLAALIVAAVLAPQLRHRVVNAGSGRAVTAREAVELLAEAAGYGGRIREDGTGPQRSTAVDWIRADISRAGGELGWAPVRDLARRSRTSGPPGRRGDRSGRGHRRTVGSWLRSPGRPC